MPAHSRKPVIGIPCDHRMLGPHPFHAVGEKYVLAVSEGAGAIPFLIPVLETPLDLEGLMDRLDGVMLTGSPSNVAPWRYAGAKPRDGVPQDERRDATTLPLLKAVVARGMPLLAICRGFQELNVAYGGTLHQHVEEVPGRIDHREDKTAPLDMQYAPVHDVHLTDRGLLRKFAGGASVIRVNSLHGQGIDKLAEGLAIEAVAPDGQIEGVAVKGAPGFALGVQWHPEWKFWEDAFSTALFAAFGQAATAYAKVKS
jgi:putative glutamine amidotransferase